MQFTLVDGGVAAITLISAILAYARGFTRELFAIGGWVIAIVVAYFMAPMLDPLMREAPVVGPFLAESCIISLIAAFTIIVALMLLVLSIFTPMISNLVLDSVLAPLDRVLGFVFGVARGLVLIAIAFLIYVNFAGAGTWPALDNAASLGVVQESADMIERNIPAGVPDWFSDRMETLMVNCEGAPADAPEATDLPDAETETETDAGADAEQDATGDATDEGTGN